MDDVFKVFCHLMLLADLKGHNPFCGESRCELEVIMRIALSTRLILGILEEIEAD